MRPVLYPRADATGVGGALEVVRCAVGSKRRRDARQPQQATRALVRDGQAKGNPGQVEDTSRIPADGAAVIASAAIADCRFAPAQPQTCPKPT
jgi:hypothetical protein